MTNYTFIELERAAYIDGDVKLANAYHDAGKFEAREDKIIDTILFIEEGMDSFAAEDFLQSLIDDCRKLSESRVTKSAFVTLCEKLEELQSEIARQSEYGREQLTLSIRELKTGDL
jgi:hypothetical protein